jgi:hypothetical protein
VPNEAGDVGVGQRDDDVTPAATTSAAAPDSTPTTAPAAAAYSSGVPGVGAELQHDASIATVAESDRGSTPQVRAHRSRSDVLVLVLLVLVLENASVPRRKSPRCS